MRPMTVPMTRPIDTASAVISTVTSAPCPRSGSECQITPKSKLRFSDIWDPEKEKGTIALIVPGKAYFAVAPSENHLSRSLRYSPFSLIFFRPSWMRSRRAVLDLLTMMPKPSAFSPRLTPGISR